MGPFLWIWHYPISDSFNIGRVKSATGLQVKLFLAKLASLPWTVFELVSAIKVGRE